MKRLRGHFSAGVRRAATRSGRNICRISRRRVAPRSSAYASFTGLFMGTAQFLGRERLGAKPASSFARSIPFEIYHRLLFHQSGLARNWISRWMFNWPRRGRRLRSWGKMGNEVHARAGLDKSDGSGIGREQYTDKSTRVYIENGTEKNSCTCKNTFMSMCYTYMHI